MFIARTRPEYNKAKVLEKIEHSDDCWNWKGHITKYGYGTYGKANHMAHRVVYELLTNSTISQEMTLDHLCKNKKCVNPNHLEQVTIRENVLRSENPNAKNARKNSCKRGHEFNETNTYYHPTRGTRHCKTCQNIHFKNYLLRKA